jgi:energy-coupling factor transporter ATP-binding protein EcfA2
VSAAIVISGLEFAYPDGRVALRGVDLVVRDGERVAVLGPNGAGKTTLALHLNGIHLPASGSVSIGGLPVLEENLAEVRRRVGLVFQDSNDQLFMPNVREDVAFGPANLGLTGDDLERRVEDALSAVGGTDLSPRPSHHLSGGMTLIVITHDLPLALELCPRSVIMRNGRIVADRATRDLFTDPDLLAENRLELPFGFGLDDS